IDDRDGDGKRECIVNYPLDRTVVISLPEHRTLYEIPSPLVHESTHSGEKILEPVGTCCGDLDSDKITDFVICYPLLGSCDVHSGADGHRLRTLAFGAPATPLASSQSSGTAVHYSPSLLGSAHAGLLVGSPNEGRGVVRILDLQSGAEGVEWSCPTGYHEFGMSVTTLIDLDDDGKPEVAMGAVKEAGSGAVGETGAVFIGFSQNHNAPVVLSTGEPMKRFGSALCQLGALGPEGRESLLIGDPGLRGSLGGVGVPVYGYNGSIWLFDYGK
ncbi:MAG: integrin alpha, partial [Planctomycetota bacterium]